MEEPNLESLKNELEFYRQNQTVVEQEVRTLIEDNQKLSHQVGVLLKEKLEHAKRGHEGHHVDKELEELRKQVALLTKERDSLHVLWQTSQKTIDALESELRTYQGYDGRGHPNYSNGKRDMELKLETSLTDYLELENKYKQLNTKHIALENEIKSKDKDVRVMEEQIKESKEKIEDLTKILEGVRIELAAEKKSNEELKNQIANAQKECVNLVKREAEAKAKVAEALQLYDVVASQKNDISKKVTEITDELLRTKQRLANIKYDTEEHFRKEIDEVKERYNEKVADMLGHIKNMDSELVEKGILLNKALREIKILQTSNENYVKQQNQNLKSIDPKLELAEQRLEAMFQELVISERRNMQLRCEKQCLVMDLQREQDLHERDSKRREWEEAMLRAECDDLRVQIENLQKSLEETHGMVNQLQETLASRTDLTEKMIATKEEEVEELNRHLENQMELNRKWKESYIDMTDKMKVRLESLESENTNLRTKLSLPTTYPYNEDTSS